MNDRWRVGTKLGRTLYRTEVLIGMIDTTEITTEIVKVMNGEAPNDRESIASALGQEANRIYKRQIMDFPSNVLDRVAANILFGRIENLTDDPWTR